MSIFKETCTLPDKSTNKRVQMYRHDLPVSEDTKRLGGFAEPHTGALAQTAELPVT